MGLRILCAVLLAWVGTVFAADTFTIIKPEPGARYLVGTRVVAEASDSDLTKTYTDLFVSFPGRTGLAPDLIGPSHWRASAETSVQGVSGVTFESSLITGRFKSVQITFFPPQDLFSQPLPLVYVSSNYWTVSGDANGAGLEAGETGMASESTVWQIFTPPITDDYLISFSRVAGYNFKSIAGYTGNDLATAQKIGEGTLNFVAHLEAGVPIRIELRGDEARFGIPAGYAVEARRLAVNHSAAKAIDLPLSAGEGGYQVARLSARDQFSSRAYLWWKWIVPEDGFAVQEGGMLMTEAIEDPVEAFKARLPNPIFVRAGQTLFFALYGEYPPSRSQPGVVYFRPGVTKPVNDDFANRAILTGDSAHLEVSLEFASAEIFGESGDLWWEYQADRAGILTVRAGSKQFYPELALYKGTLAALTTIGVREETLDDRLAEVKVNAGDKIIVRVGRDLRFRGAPPSPVILDVKFLSPAPAPNDIYTGAILLTGRSWEFHGRVEEATKQADEWETGEQFWRFEVPEDGVISLESLPDDAEVIMIPRAQEPGGIFGRGNFEYYVGENRRRVAVKAGETFYVGVAGKERLTGGFTIRGQFHGISENDAFANAIPLNGVYEEFYGFGVNSTLEENEPNHKPPFPATTGGSLWWRWTAPATGMVNLISTNGSAQIHVYTGDSFANLNKISGETPFGERIAFGATAGVSYYIAVVSVGLENPGPGSYDAFSVRLKLYGTLPDAGRLEVVRFLPEGQILLRHVGVPGVTYDFQGSLRSETFPQWFTWSRFQQTSRGTEFPVNLNSADVLFFRVVDCNCDLTF